MSIWVHCETGEAPSIGEIVELRCRSCNSRLVQVQVEDRWAGISNEISELHRDTVLEMAKVHGDFMLREMELIHEPDERGSMPFHVPPVRLVARLQGNLPLHQESDLVCRVRHECSPLQIQHG